MDLAASIVLKRRYARAVLRACGVDVSRVSWRGALDALWAVRAMRDPKNPLPDFPEFCESIGEPLESPSTAPLSDTAILRGF